MNNHYGQIEWQVAASPRLPVNATIPFTHRASAEFETIATIAAANNGVPETGWGVLMFGTMYTGTLAQCLRPLCLVTPTWEVAQEAVRLALLGKQDFYYLGGENKTSKNQ